MKTRIRVVEYGDGRKEYFPEVKDRFKDILVEMIYNRPIAFTLFFYIAIPLAAIWSVTWLPIINNPYSDEGKFMYRTSLDKAQKEIDLYFKRIKYKKTNRAEKELSKKKIKIEYLTYP